MGPWLTKEVMSKHCSNVLQDLPALLKGQALHHLLIEQHTVCFLDWCSPQCAHMWAVGSPQPWPASSTGQ
jgi:hypothetical protein